MRKKRFTLIELLVVVLIFASIFVAILGILTIGKRSWRMGTIQAEIQQEARRAMGVMVRNLRGASSVDTGTFVSGISDDFIRFTSSGQTIEYALSGNELQKTVSSTTTFVARDIESVQFKLLGTDTIHIVLTTQKSSAFTGVMDTVLNSQVVLRN